MKILGDEFILQIRHIMGEIRGFPQAIWIDASFSRMLYEINGPDDWVCHSN